MESQRRPIIMEEKVAIIGIFIQDISAAAKVNELLHEYAYQKLE